MIRILFLILLIGAIGGFVYVAMSALSGSEGEGSPESTETYTDLDIQQNSDTSTVVDEDMSSRENQIIISSTVAGETLVLSDSSLEENDVEVLAEGFSLLFDKKAVGEVSAYDIFYDRPSESITIYLYELPLSTSRQAALDVLVSKFNTSVEQLCGFNVSVQTNQYVSPEYSGRELGLPGCPNAVSLP